MRALPRLGRSGVSKAIISVPPPSPGPYVHAPSPLLHFCSAPLVQTGTRKLRLAVDIGDSCRRRRAVNGSRSKAWLRICTRPWRGTGAKTVQQSGEIWFVWGRVAALVSVATKGSRLLPGLPSRPSVMHNHRLKRPSFGGLIGRRHRLSRQLFSVFSPCPALQLLVSSRSRQ